MSRRAVSMQDLPTAGRWAIYLALAAVFAVACAFLANWQFARNEERSAQLDLVAQNYDAPAVPVAELLESGFDPGDQWRPVVMTGSYLPEEQLLVRNRAHGGSSAFEVLVPFRTGDGRVLLINRGWVPPGEGPEPDAVPAAPAGEVTVVARLQPGEPVPRSGRSAPEGQVPTINLPLVADEIGGDVRQSLELGAYGLLASEDPAPGTRPQPLESPSEDPGPHLSYAIQWILFAVMGFVFIGYVIRTERAHRRDDEDAAPTRRPGSRRRDRDAETEDALLDAAGR